MPSPLIAARIGSMPRFYSAADHQRGFEIYCQTRNYQRVADAVGANYATVYKWGSASYSCPSSCPYHNWEKLMELKVPEGTQLSIQEQNVEEVTKNPHLAEFLDAANDPRKLVKSNLERLAVYEMLFNKTYYDLTGQVLTFGTDIRDANGAKIDLESLMKKGMKVTTFEGGVTLLMKLQERIEALKMKINPQVPAVSSTRSNDDEDFDAPASKKRYTIEELRNMKNLLTGGHIGEGPILDRRASVIDIPQVCAVPQPAPIDIPAPAPAPVVVHGVA